MAALQLGRGPLWATALLFPTLGFASLLSAQGSVNESLLQITAACSARPAIRPGEPAALVAAARRSLVHVFVEVDNGRTRFPIERPSSGVIVAGGRVLTWLGLVREAQGATDKRILVVFADANATTVSAKLVASDERSGLALLALDQPLPTGCAAMELADSQALAAGEPVLVLSRPDAKEWVAYAGVASRPLAGTTLAGRPIAASDLIATDAMIEARCQGAALIDAAGRLLGLCNAEHVSRDVAEATLADLKAPSFGIAIAAHVVAVAFRDQLPATVPTAARASPRQVSETASAAAAIAPAIVSVWAGEGSLPSLGMLDPLATLRRAGLGSGVIVSASGLVLTNLHLLLGKKAVTVTLLDGRTFPAILEGKHSGTNIALLKIALPNGTQLVPALCGDGSDAILCETVLGIGNPLGHTLSVSVGVLSAKRGNDRLLQADPNLGNQNAGGALVDITGRLLGIVDGGVIDRIDLAYARQGDQAKTETNLSTCVDLQTIRRNFTKQFEELADPKDSIRVTPGAAPATRAARTSLRTKVVTAVGAAMLNVYVSHSSRKSDAEANPFADQQQAKIVGESLGSGVILDRQGLAVTNWHVVSAATEPDGSMRKDHVVSVRLWDGSVCEATVLSISREDDLALLQLVRPEQAEFVAVELGDSAALQVGEGVLAIGNPLGFANTITAGIVTAKAQGIRVKGRWAKLENLIETDAAINGGNSGGALLDLGGRLVGINSAGSHGFSSHGYAIPVNHVRTQILDLLLSPEKLRCANFGMRIGTESGRVLVREIDPRGPAARAGLQVGDHIVRFDKTAITWSVGFARRLLATSTERACELDIERAGKPIVVTVQPLTAPAWAVLLQTGIEAEQVPFEREPELVRAASLALHRKFSGDARSEPISLLPSVVRVLRTVSEDLRPGDLLLGVEFRQEGTTAEASTLRRFTTLEAVQACFDDPATGSYEGKRYPCWVFRAGAVEVVSLRAKRLMQ